MKLSRGAYKTLIEMLDYEADVGRPLTNAEHARWLKLAQDWHNVEIGLIGQFFERLFGGPSIRRCAAEMRERRLRTSWCA